MADYPGFIFYPGDYLRDTQNLSEKSQVAYDRIMCEHMRNICITQQQLKFFTKRLSPDEVEELKMVLTKTINGFFIKWVAESIEKSRKYSDSRRNNRKGKNKLLPENSNNISESYVPHMESENESGIENDIVSEKENELLTSEIWHEQSCMALKIDMMPCKKMIKEFIIEMKAKEDFNGRTIKDLKHHFVSWAKIEIKKNSNGEKTLRPKDAIGTVEEMKSQKL